MASGSTTRLGSDRGTASSEVLFWYSTSFNAATSTSTVTITPYIYSSASWGSLIYAFARDGQDWPGVYGGQYESGTSRKYVLDSSYGGSNRYLSASSADYGELSPSVGSISTFEVKVDKTGKGTIYCGFCGTFVSAYDTGTYSIFNSIGQTPRNAYGCYAEFTETAPYSITYNANGGSGAPASQAVFATYSYTLQSGTPTRSGYTFLGWATSASATTTAYQPGASVTISGNLALYAVWKANTWTISYNANGGSSTPANQTKTYNVALTLASAISRTSASAGSYTVTYNYNYSGASNTTATAARTTSYTFKNWSTAQTGGTAYNAGASYTANAAATMWAQWNSSTTTASVTLPSPTRSGYALNGWYTAASGGTKAGNGGASYTPTGNVTLYAQWTAQASTITSSSSSVDTLGSFSLTVSRVNSAFYHKATFNVGGTTLATSSAFATSLSYTVPRTWFNSFPNDTSKTVTVSVQTYTTSACTTTVGSPATTTFTMKADSGIKPTVLSGWASLAYYNTGTAASGISGYVKGYSKAQATFDATKITYMNGAGFSSYSVTCQGSTDSSSPYLTPVLTSTSVSVVCTVTDTRGRSTSQTFTLTVMDYSKPSLSGISVYRCDSNGTADEDGTSYSVKATRSFSSLNGENSCSLVCASAASGGSYGSNTTLTSGTRKIISGISADTSYTVRITATDSLGNSAVYYAAIPTRKWAMKFRSDGNGVAFGKSAETANTFEVTSDWDVKFGKPLPVSSGGTGCTSGIIRPNLLDNWYFVGGGSQGGWGKFPINQRGQTTYSSLGVCGIDRWKLNTAVGFTLASGYASFEAISQSLPSASDLVGKTLTASVLLSSGALYSGTATLTTLSSNTVFYSANNVTLRWSSYWNGFQVFCNTSGNTINVIAIKLELGSSQTLAHQENGTWVLNEIPRFEDELTKCQSYFSRVTCPAGSTTLPAIARLTSTANRTILFILPLPAELAKNPTVTFTGTLTLRSFADSSASTTISSITGAYRILPSYVEVDAVTAGTPYDGFILIGSGSYIDISAELL